MNRDPVDSAQPDDSDGEYEFASVGVDLRGVDRAQRAYLDEARKIPHGAQELAEYLRAREPRGEILRLEAWRAICASAVYLARKNLPFSADIRHGNYDPQ